MIWVESLSTEDKQQLQNDTSENKIDISEDQNKRVDKTTEFLQNFDWDQTGIIQASIEGIQNDTQLKIWFENMLKSGISEDLINTIKQELDDGIKWGLDEETLILRIQSIIAENIPEFQIDWVSAIESSVNWKNEKIEQVKTEAEQVKTDAEQAKADKERENTIKQMKEVIVIRDKLTEKYKKQNLDEKTNKDSDNYKAVKVQLENDWILNQLKESGYDDNFINDYILVRTTLAELKFNSTKYEQDDISYFDKLVKNIDNACNIPDTKLSSFSSENIAQTRTELFNEDVWNESLINTKKSNKNSHDYSEVFPEKTEKEKVQTYWKLLPSDFKDSLNNYIQHLKNNTLDEYMQTDECKNLLKAIDNIEASVEDRTKDLVEELCIISQIKWMYMCMWESVDFDLNKANEIKSENWILILNGHIDWVNFAIRQDTNNPKARLQTSTKLAKEWNSSNNTDNKENFTIWWEESKFVDSNFILPTQEQIFKTITDTIKSDSSLVNFDNQSDYLDNLQSTIMSNIDNQYENTKYVHHYMQEQVKWEKIIDKTISFVEKMKGSKPDSIVSNSNTQLYDFLNLMDFNIKHSTSVEKDKLNRAMDKINRMADLAQDNSTDSELENHKDKFAKYLTGDTLLQTRNILNGGSIEESTQYAFDLFKNYENQSDSRNNGELHMINFDQMLNDLNIAEMYNKQEKEERYDQNDAEKILRWIEENM